MHYGRRTIAESLVIKTNGEEVSHMVLKSWENNEVLEHLAMQQRNGEMVKGVIRSIKTMKLPPKMVEEDVLIVALPGGVTGYCAASDFRERSFRNLDQFVTHSEMFIITRLDLDNNMAILSEKLAGEKQRAKFWDTIEELQAKNALDTVTFEGQVTGYNQMKGIIYVRINGQDTYMFRNEWSWREREVVDAQNGETVTVKVTLFDRESSSVRVSRRAALKDPWELIGDSLQLGQVIAGRVSQVHPIHGLFVEIENGVEIKAGKMRSLEEPDVGDFVSCRLQKLDIKKRNGRVTIIGYPRGKQKKKDLGSFLFD